MKVSAVTPVIGFLLLIASSASRSPDTENYQFNYENVLGTSFQLNVISSSEQAADAAEYLALNEIDRLAGILSTYDPASEISRWQGTQGISAKVSIELFEVLDLFDKWNTRTAGALSASIGHASTLWKKSELNQVMPSEKQLEETAKAMKQPQWRLDHEAQTAIHIGHEPLALNTFVKSYIIRKVSDIIMSVPGVSGAVTNVGGDIVISGAHTEHVLVTNPMSHADNDDPLSVLSLRDRAVATSGNYRRGFKIGDQWFSHIIDARTALPASNVISATVIAKNATDAGALATAFNILEPEESKALAREIPDLEYHIVMRNGTEITSEGWNALEVSSMYKTHVVKDKEKYKLAVTLELARLEGRSRRPYVAVWIENKKKESVRTLALWYGKPRWLPDLRRFNYRKQLPAKEGYSAMSATSATRSAGKYTLSWDGVDDQGNVSPKGIYTVYVEAVREHGTYQLIEQEIEWNGKLKHIDCKGGTEIISASIDIQNTEAE